MNSETGNDVEETSKPPRPKLTRAGRLLQILTTGSVNTCDRLARQLRVPVRDLEACRDGTRSLDPEVQILLAALVLEIAPEYGVLAHRLHAQAQSALRVKLGAVESHLTYYRTRWR